VTDKDGNVIGTGTVDKDGNFVVDLDKPLTNGEDVTVQLEDKAGNKSPEVTVTAPDTTAPDAPTDLEVTRDGLILTGKGEPNTTVTIKDVTGAIVGTGTVGIDGKFVVDLIKPFVNGEKLNVSLKDKAENESPNASVNAQDTTAPDAPTDLDVHQDGLKLTGKGEPNTTVTVKDKSGTVVGTGVVDAAGNLIAHLDKPFTNGEALDVTLTDAAGNTSAPATVNAKDTTPPDAPSDLVFADDGASITGKAEPGSTVIVRLPNNGAVVGTATADEHGNFTVPVKPALINGEEVDVVAVDQAGNESAEAPINAPDLVAPEIIDVQIDTDNIVLTVETEPHATVKLYDSEGKPLLDKNGNQIEFKADDQGKASYSFDPAIERGKIVNITATDAAGNESDPYKLIAGLAEILAPADNVIDLILDATPLSTTDTALKGSSKTGLTVVNVGLGPVLGADVLANLGDSSVVIDVGANQVKDVTLQGSAFGVQVVGTMDLYVYKLNESTGQWEQHAVKPNWVVSVLLGGKSKETEFNLGQGKWMFVMASGQGIQALTGYTLKVTNAINHDYNEATSVKGSTSGNMLTDEDPKFGKDDLPEGTTITSINGQQLAGHGEVVIQGLYGKLTVKADGSYTYTVDPDFRGPFGAKDVFNYVVTSPAGNSAEAKLEIELNITPSEDRIEIHNTVVLELEPQVTLDTDKSTIKSATGFKLLDLGLLGPILSADALTGAGAMEFSVGENQVRELTFHGSAGGISLGKVFDLVIFKLDPATGNFVQVHYEKDWFKIILLGGKSDQLTMQFGEGEYRAMLNSKGLLGVAEGSGLYVDHDKVYDYNIPTKYQGSVTGDATAEDSTALLKVNGKDVEPGKATTVEGKYGTLTINIDGTYTYTVVKPANAGAGWKPPYGAVDTFRLVTQDANGKSVVETLNIKVGTHAAQDDSAVTIVEQHNVVSTVEFHEKDGLGNYGKAYSKSFEIKEKEIGKGFNLKVTGTSDLGDGFLGLGKKDMTMTYVLKNTTTGQQWTFTSVKGKDAGLDLSGQTLPAGSYTLNVTSQDGVIEQIDFVANIVHLDEYVSSAAQVVTGNILANDDGITKIDSLRVGAKEVFVNDPKKGAASIEIEGQYGTLTINKDGSYSYKPNGKAFGVEHFTYETISKLGVKEVAVLEINVGKNVVASEYADHVESSSANDTFTLGAGADTVIYDVLDSKIANAGGNGGNGVDTWTDFNANDGDKIDISKLLDGNQTADNIKDYVTYENGVLKIDRNGQADYSGQPEGKSNYVDLININSDKTLDELLNNNNIVWH
ncbi:BapA/Bap/LapF family large adhesin, partial [Acinetobacter rudis]